MRDYSTLSTATLVKIQGRSAQDSAEERAIREELRRRGEIGSRKSEVGSRKYPRGRRQPLLFAREQWESTREKERV